MEDQDGRYSLRNVRSLPHDADVKGDIVRQIIYPPKLVVRALIFLKLRKWEGSGIPPPLPIEEDQKKPDLNEVKPISFARFDNKSMNRPPSPPPPHTRFLLNFSETNYYLQLPVAVCFSLLTQDW